MPNFTWFDFVPYSLDYINSHPWALVGLLFVAGLAVLEACLAAAFYGAERKALREAENRAAALTVAQDQQRKQLGAVVQMSARNRKDVA